MPLPDRKSDVNVYLILSQLFLIHLSSISTSDKHFVILEGPLLHSVMNSNVKV